MSNDRNYIKQVSSWTNTRTLKCELIALYKNKKFRDKHGLRQIAQVKLLKIKFLHHEPA